MPHEPIRSIPYTDRNIKMLKLRPMPRKPAVLLITAAATLAVLLFFRRPVVLSQSTPALTGENVVSLRVRFGPGESKPTTWDGHLTVTGGELVSLRNWHPRPSDRVGKNDWTLAAEAGPTFQLRPWDELPLTGSPAYLKTPGLIVDVRATAATRLKFQTKNGPFEVTPASVRAGAPLKALNGRVVVDRVVPADLLSPADYQNDFATMLSGSGEVWAAWVAYRDNGDEIFARRFDGKTWGAAQKVTESPSDVFLAKMGRDRAGKPWVVWSAQVKGNFDLYARRFDGAGWSAVDRLTEDPQPDIYHSVTTDAAGNLWVVWQAF